MGLLRTDLRADGQRAHPADRHQRQRRLTRDPGGAGRRARCATAAGLLACALLAACGGTEDVAPKRVTIDVDRTIGRHAKATAKGIVDDPVAVAIRVSAAPRQRVSVAWGLSCPKTDDGDAKGTGGTYTTTPPNVRALRLPRRKIAFCAVRGEARLSRSGRVKVTLLASRR
jgi:hypothetical protein